MADKEKLNIAILSPNQNKYSETFINAHKNGLDGNIFFYYGGVIPDTLEDFGKISGGMLDDAILDVFENNNRFKRLFYLQKSLVDRNIDIVLCEYGVTAAESLLAIKSAGIPLVTHFHGYDASVKDVLKKYNKEYREIFEYSEKIVVVSKKMQEMIEEIGCNPSKIVHAACAPNEDFFALRPQFRSRQFFAAGRFVHKKAPYYTVLAFKDVLKKHPNAVLKMAGEGPYLDICKDIVKNCGIQENVIFLGSVNHDRIKEEMENSVAFVQHSITAENGDMEGTPVAIVESGATGIPVVATSHAGIPDIVVDGETGFLVGEHDVCGMANAMVRILDDPNRTKEMGRVAKDRLREIFPASETAPALNVIMNQLGRNFSRKEDIFVLINEAKKDLSYRIAEKEKEIAEKNKELLNIRVSKSFRLGELFFRSCKKPYKLITYPYNFFKILLEKDEN